MQVSQQFGRLIGRAPKLPLAGEWRRISSQMTGPCVTAFFHGVLTKLPFVIAIRAKRFGTTELLDAAKTVAKLLKNSQLTSGQVPLISGTGH
jgi:hypothetical protein